MSGVILWFTGLSGAGKTTLAKAVGAKVGLVRPVEILDGDEIRPHLSKELGFSKEDRDSNIRRIGFVARMLARHDVFVITAAISPYAQTRDEVRQLATAEGIAFIEIFVEAQLQSLIDRDVKGLYKRALAGALPNFTGISDPYEPPPNPDLVVRTDVDPLDRTLLAILGELANRSLVPRSLLD